MLVFLKPSVREGYSSQGIQSKVCLFNHRAFSTIQETRIQTAYTSLLVTQILCPTTLLFVFQTL